MSYKRVQKAFVLIKAKTGRERELADELMKYGEVREVHIIPGEWEIVAPSDEKVLGLVMQKISKNRQVRDTYTIIPHFSKFR